MLKAEDGPPRNLWQLSGVGPSSSRAASVTMAVWSLAGILNSCQFRLRGMDRVPQKLREHILKDFTDWVSTTANGVSMLGWWVGRAVKTHGQQVHSIHVGFPAFQEVHPLAHATGQRYTLGMRLDASQSGFWHLQLSSKGFPTRSSAGQDPGIELFVGLFGLGFFAAQVRPAAYWPRTCTGPSTCLLSWTWVLWPGRVPAP